MSTPNMSLTLPVIGSTLAPTWAIDLNNDLSLLDTHNHAPGNGVAIEPNGMNISSDLSFLQNNATNLRSSRYVPISLGSLGVTDLDCLIVSGVDLYYIDGNGNQVRITQSGGIVGTPGSIGNLVSPASVTYVGATPAFVFQSNANTSADLDGGSVNIRQNIANAKAVTLSSPTSLAADYTLTFPAALPGATNIVTINSSGVIAAVTNVDNSTIEISSNNLQVKDLGITGAKIANSTITAGKLASNLDLPGDNVKMGGKFAIVSRTEMSARPCTVQCVFNASGGLTAGEGATCVRNSTGNYTVTWNNLFTGTATPTILVTAGQDDLNQVVKINSSSNSQCNIHAKNSTTGAAVDSIFHIFAIGPWDL